MNDTYSKTIRISGLLVVYVVILVFSLVLAVFVRFDFNVPQEYWGRVLISLPWIILIKVGLLAAFGQFRSLLTFFSLPDAKRIAMAMGIAALLELAAWWIVGADKVIPRGVIVTDMLLSFLLLSSMRSALRVYRESMFVSEYSSKLSARKRTLIIGAGSSGAALLREILSKPGLSMNVVGFVDDDPAKVGSSIHARPIYGPIARLAEIIEHLIVAKVVLAMPGAKPAVVREVVAVVNKAGVEVDILPSFVQLLHREVTISHLRQLEPEDLLGRDPISLDDAEIDKVIRDRVAMVTGAGGSIGSELCRQLAEHLPRKLILVERSEPALFSIEQELRRTFPFLAVEPLAVNVCEEGQMLSAFESHAPALVFHAAAHKHVPLMESQPAEAVLNNVYGTEIVCRLAGMHGCEKLVLISTDKAVNPTNVMGATKRMAELVVQEYQRITAPNGCAFSVVRFGNVLGSSGSVIPVFHRQIAEGGPVTVTHPEVTRFFMSIPEAVGLILQSAMQTCGGEIFVLDMGEPVKIRDLARQMIELSGFRPEEDIKIAYTGLRPGEKLYEEPIHAMENVGPTQHPKVRLLRNDRSYSDHPVLEELRRLRPLLSQTLEPDIRRIVQTFVPEFHV